MAGVSDNLREFGSWSEQTSSSGRKYYYNSESEVSQWDKPKEWKDHELRLEAERQAAEQHRMQFQPVPPPPPPPFFQNFPFNGGNIPPQPNYQGYQGGRMGAAPPVSHYSNSFMPPNSIPPVPPPPRNPLPRHPDIGGSIYPTPQYRNYFPPPMPPAPKYNTAPAGAPVQRGPSSSSVNRNYGRPSPSTAQGQQSRYPAHDGRAPSQVGPHSRDEQGKPHPYATPQPIMNQSYQTTPKRPTRDSRDGYDSERPKQQQQYKREYEAGSSTDESPASKRPAMQQQQSQDDDRMDISIGKEEEEEEQGQTGKEEWRPYYRPDLSQKKAAELGLEDDTELGDIQMQCIVLENKWQNMEIQAKQAAAVRMVVEQEVAMTNMRIESCRQQQREIEAKSMHQVPLSGDKRREYLENLQRRLRSMKLEPRVSS